MYFSIVRTKYSFFFQSNFSPPFLRFLLSLTFADKIKDKFIIKYYQTTKDGKSDIEIPKKDIWTVKHNGKRFNYQDDNNLFIYEKQGNNYIKHIDHFGHKNTVENGKYAIKKCYSDSWCKLYPNYWKIDLYIKKSILDKPLSER